MLLVQVLLPDLFYIIKSLKLAIVNSAYVTTKVGAQNGLLTRKEAEKKMGCK